jgi:hypothetical protein
MASAFFSKKLKKQKTEILSKTEKISAHVYLLCDLIASIVGLKSPLRSEFYLANILGHLLLRTCARPQRPKR